jgi:hypothetical protein
MNPNRNYLKVAFDMFWIQASWTLAGFFTMAVVQIVKSYFAIRNGSEIGDFFTNTLTAGVVFVLVIGIISASIFLQIYVNQGVTRRDHFIGGAIAALGLSIMIVVVALILTSLESFIVNLMDLPITYQTIIEEEIESNIIANIVLTVVSPTFLNLDSLPWIVYLMVIVLRLFMFYLIGWFIAAGFYHSGVITGLGTILLSIIFISGFDLFWQNSPNNILTKYLSLEVQSFSPYIAILMSIIIIGIVLFLIRILTKKVAIRLF